MRIMATGEGHTDIGFRDYNTGEFLEGPVLTYIRRILPSIEMDVLLWDRKTADSQIRGKGFRIQGRKGKLAGHGKIAFIFKAMANEESVDLACFYSDADKGLGVDARKEKACERRYKELKDEIENGFKAADSLCQDGACDGIAIIPVKMIESWLLSDKGAFDKAFGNVKKCEKFPDKPELEWGAKNDKNSNYPKNQLNRILDAYGQQASREVFCQIAEETDLNVINKKCPISFTPFYDYLEKLQNG